ncbi:hypothetical protein CYMTET_43029 [Cymbomonas tetramitiformis]|uniref:Uncharacterized protein n=1 Tax=Cymbomonas tetramitiformis TaxID=36881 RepID=A0AAE0C4A2_9CHLO|nr:hypothetical protein CYMTET_43029 [Cymbomonas tetramitiformis]
MYLPGDDSVSEANKSVVAAFVGSRFAVARKHIRSAPVSGSDAAAAEEGIPAEYREPSKHEKTAIKSIERMLFNAPNHFCQVAGTGWRFDEYDKLYYSGKEASFCCTVCRDAGDSGEYGRGVAKRVQSKAMVSHCTTKSHLNSLKVLEDRAKSSKKRKLLEPALGAFKNWQGVGRFSVPKWKMCSLFSIIYTLAIGNVPFAHYEKEVECWKLISSYEEMFECPIPLEHYSDRRRVPEFLSYMSDLLIKSTLDLFNRARFFTLLIDECTTKSIRSSAAIYVAFRHPDSFQPVVFYLGLFELDGASGFKVFLAVLKWLIDLLEPFVYYLEQKESVLAVTFKNFSTLFILFAVCDMLTCLNVLSSKMQTKIWPFSHLKMYLKDALGDIEDQYVHSTTLDLEDSTQRAKYGGKRMQQFFEKVGNDGRQYYGDILFNMDKTWGECQLRVAEIAACLVVCVYARFPDIEVLTALCILDPKMLPRGDPNAEEDPLTTYGIAEIRLLYTHYSTLLVAESVEQLLEEWKKFRTMMWDVYRDAEITTFLPQVAQAYSKVGEDDRYPNMLTFVELGSVVVMQNATTERGFAHLNDIMTHDRTRMEVRTANDILTIKMLGPDLGGQNGMVRKLIGDAVDVFHRKDVDAASDNVKLMPLMHRPAPAGYQNLGLSSSDAMELEELEEVEPLSSEDEED